MTGYPRLTIDLDVVAENTRLLAARLRDDGFTLVGVTKCVDGEPRVGRALLAAGCAGLADSRLPSLARLAAASLGPLTLIRAPQPDELATAARVAHRILLSDPGAARTLGEHAAGSPVEILLTVDLGDRREGVLPDAAPAVARATAGLPGVVLAGISVNFACLSGQLPTRDLFRQAEVVLEEVADACVVEPQLSLGGTCVVQHLDGYRPRFRTEIRSGGGPIYGCDAFGHVPEGDLPDDDANYALLYLGRRDCEPGSLRPLLPGSYLAGATSDVSVLITPEPLLPGDTVSFAVDYDALVRAVTSPFVAKALIAGATSEVSKGDS